MGERKVLNKYYPPSFDPKKIPRIRKSKNLQKKVRTMVPLRRIRCNTCGNYISGGTKSNSRVEEVIDETYLGLKIYRIYFKCTNCCAELILKTDRQNLSYVVESGATCVYDRQMREKKQAEGSEDVMSSLEKRSLVSKREIEVMTTLDELKSMKARRSSVSVDSMLEALRRKREQEEAEEEEDLVKSIRFGKQRRIEDEQEIDNKKKRRMEAIDEKKPKTSIQISSVRVITSKKKTTSMGLASLCHNYGSDEED